MENDPSAGGGCFSSQVPGVRVLSALAPLDGAMEQSMKVPGETSSVTLDRDAEPEILGAFFFFKDTLASAKQTSKQK